MNVYIDLIIRIKNGYMARRAIVESPYSKFKEQILKKLQTLKLIKSFKVTGDKIKKIEIELMYDSGEPAFSNIKIYSTPGRRWYVNSKSLKPIKGGLASALLSTPKGVLTNMEAKKEGVGGELLFEVW